MDLGKEETVYQLQRVGTCRGLWDSTMPEQTEQPRVAHGWPSSFLAVWPKVSHFCPEPVAVRELNPVGGGKADTTSEPPISHGSYKENNRLQPTASDPPNQPWERTVDQPLVFHYKRGKSNPSMINTYLPRPPSAGHSSERGGSRFPALSSLPCQDEAAPGKTYPRTNILGTALVSHCYGKIMTLKTS